MKALITGIDSLDIGYCIQEYICYPEMFDELDEAKRKAGEKEFKNYEGGYNLFGMDFIVKPFGAGRYDYILVNDNVTIKVCHKVSSGTPYPEVSASFRSQYLWDGYWYKKVKDFEDWLKTWAWVVGSKVSRVDLTTDIQAELPIFDGKFTGLITRARKKTDYGLDRYTNGRLETGYRIGSGSLMCRIYPKAYEVKGSNKEWFYPLWEANGWDGKSDITRTEFQCRRDYLKPWQVNTIEDVLNQAPDLWKYNTEKWISIRVPGKDAKHHANRWGNTELWNAVINSGKKFGELSGVVKLEPGLPKYDHLMKMIIGCASSAQAINGMNIAEELKKITETEEFQEEVKKKEYRQGRYQ